jgi:putative dimethyl sulfoxide reductase chaperone
MDKTSDQDLKEILTSRSASYAFLSRAYRQEMTVEMLKTLGATTSAHEDSEASEGNRVFSKFLRGLDGADLKQVGSDLAAEFAALFLNASRQPVYPFESVYTSKEGLLMQRARDEVLNEYRRAGLERIQAFKEPEDHIALELEFMSYLCNKTLDSLQAQDRTAAHESLEWQKRFFDEHLVVWIPRFCKDLVQFAQSDFYKGLALLTAELLEMERETIPALLAELAMD